MLEYNYGTNIGYILFLLGFFVCFFLFVCFFVFFFYAHRRCYYVRLCSYQKLMLLCSKLCWHNVPNPNEGDNIGICDDKTKKNMPKDMKVCDL